VIRVVLDFVGLLAKTQPEIILKNKVLIDLAFSKLASPVVL
jgi:hypothetical protein